MKLAMISFTRQGGVLAGIIEEKLQKADLHMTRYAFWKYSVSGAISFEKGDALLESVFTEYDGLVFVAAAGIAVRLIAPHVVSKLSDPAVLCIDEQGNFVISLLSGHIGGANALTREIAACISAQPVITTATDAGGRFSPDSFAMANHLKIEDMDMAKKIAAAVVQGEQIGLLSDYPCKNLYKVSAFQIVPIGETYEELVPVNGICISGEKKETPFLNTLYLTPKDVVLGIGCKRNTKPELLEAFVLEKLQGYGISMNAVRCICSIDLKKNEQAILTFSKKYHIPFQTFSAEELMRVQGEFTASEFVKETTGADNVCERSAMKYGSELIMPKQAGSGITLAAARAEVEIDFQKEVVFGR